MRRRHQVVIIVHIGNPENLADRAGSNNRLVEDLGLAEMAGEGDVFLIGDALIGKYHHQMVHPRIVNSPV